MKKFILLLLLLAVGLSSGVYGQQTTARKSDQRLIKPYTPPGFPHWEPLLPRRDTVIMLGEEIEVGGYLSEQMWSGLEIIGYGKAKKSDIRKGIYSIKLKPKQTTTYEVMMISSWRGSKHRFGRIVYVAKNAEEKKRLEEKLNTTLPSGQFTTYQYTPPGEKPIKITYTQSTTVK